MKFLVIFFAFTCLQAKAQISREEALPFSVQVLVARMQASLAQYEIDKTVASDPEALSKRIYNETNIRLSPKHMVELVAMVDRACPGSLVLDDNTLSYKDHEKTRIKRNIDYQTEDWAYDFRLVHRDSHIAAHASAELRTSIEFRFDKQTGEFAGAAIHGNKPSPWARYAGSGYNYSGWVCKVNSVKN